MKKIISLLFSSIILILLSSCSREDEIKNEKSQAFIICPFIEESESMATVKAATKGFENLKKELSNFKLGLIHGKLKSKEKENVLNKL